MKPFIKRKDSFKSEHLSIYYVHVVQTGLIQCIVFKSLNSGL